MSVSGTRAARCLAHIAFAAVLSSPVAAQRDTANLPLTALPPFPQAMDLVLQLSDPGDTIKLFVDRRSVTTEDQETRLAYVVETQTGIRNVFLEGFRCDGRRYSTYAIGSGAGPWMRVETPTWQTASRVRTNNARAKLLDDGYLCGRFREQLPASEVLQRLGRIIETTPP